LHSPEPIDRPLRPENHRHCCQNDGLEKKAVAVCLHEWLDGRLFVSLAAENLGSAALDRGSGAWLARQWPCESGMARNEQTARPGGFPYLPHRMDQGHVGPMISGTPPARQAALKGSSNRKRHWGAASAAAPHPGLQARQQLASHPPLLELLLVASQPLSARL